MGGLCESAVKSFMSHLKNTAGDHKFNYEEFTQSLVYIEAVLNPRPISPLARFLRFYSSIHLNISSEELHIAPYLRQKETHSL